MTVDERAIVGAVSKMWIFRRAIVNGLEFQSALYKKNTARNNFTVIFHRNGKNHYGSVLKYVKYAVKCTRMSCAQLHGRCSCTLPMYYIALVKETGKTHLPTSIISRYANSQAHQTGDFSRRHHCCANFIHPREMYED
ncbi:hypothetical protein OS493_018772 [Desmophyllum pertusum]|uniref:Uncharacterized protein n=1 Tax=Desmophyllum pertusum TaxID=174260 RepID=A0A9W9ZC00_9CNID|nr:hypothetical protein OS493_018772 [Desmophyllum pertusum]